jgi:2-oxoglutarate ferredoxin oxidoreductase subunit alpha
MLGQMMEPIEFREIKPRELPPKDWAANGRKNHNGTKNIINSLILDPVILEQHNLKLQQKYKNISVSEQKAEVMDCEDADLVIVAYGSTARIAKTALAYLRKNGIKAGLFRPISLWPFPVDALESIIDKTKGFLAVEMSAGQMVEDLRLFVRGQKQVHFYGRMGGMVPTPEEIAEKATEIIKGW